jgi:hypothetical protein
MAALGALGAWRAQVLGGRKVQLAERCLYAVRDFSVRIKVVRMEQTNIDQQMDEIRKSWRDFQGIYLRLNYYASPPISKCIPETLGKCFVTLDTKFRELKGFDFQAPKPVGGTSLEGAGVNAQEKLRYQNANNTFYGLSDADQIGTGLIEAERQLAAALYPILNPRIGCLGQVIDKITTWF